MIKNLPASEGDSRESGSIPGSGRFPGGGNGHPLMFSLGNPTEKGAWQSLGSQRVEGTERANTLKYQ